MDSRPKVLQSKILTFVSVYIPVRSGVNPSPPSCQSVDEDLSNYNFFYNLSSPEKNIPHLKEFENLEDKYGEDYESQYQETAKNVSEKSKHISTSDDHDEDLNYNTDDYKQLEGLADGRVWYSEGLYRKPNVKHDDSFSQKSGSLDNSKPQKKKGLVHNNRKRVTSKETVIKGEVLRGFPYKNQGEARGVQNQISKELSLKEQESVDNSGKGHDKSSDEKGKKDETDRRKMEVQETPENLKKNGDMKKDRDGAAEVEMNDQRSSNPEEKDAKKEKSYMSEQRSSDGKEGIKQEAEENIKENNAKKQDEERKDIDKVDEDGEKREHSKDEGKKSINSEEKKEGGKENDKNEARKESSQKSGNSNSIVTADIVTGKLYPTIVKEPYSAVTNFWSSELEQRFQSGFETAPPLKVIVVPFSHNDAAWLMTFDEYFVGKSKKILDNIAKELIRYKDMTFVWSEICFLSRWWKSASRQLREDFLDLVRTNRVEICPGGWVMPDEACPHLFALLVQLTEGHMWVKDNLGVLPKVGWSIDPFGHSSTMAYFMQEAGLTLGNVVQRLHYGWKSHFAKQRTGDFMWKQNWDRENKHGMLTHQQPFNIYSTTASCGPHPEVCQQFDFNLSTATPITYGNVKMRTELLFSEYWRTGSLFPHNVVLVPLGDDFRYTSAREFSAQYRNYKAIMDYGNSDKKLRTEISFGTPSDYFRLATKRLCKFPVLQGDFFPYADYDDKGPAYWTGFYSTRPHHKKLTRVAEWNLRSAEILFTLSLNLARQNRIEHDSLRRLYLNLINARRQISLFQHHDGITGTSKAYVMEDFRNRLIEANTNSILVQSGSIQYIFGSADPETFNYSPTNLTPLSIIIKEQDLATSMYTRIIPGRSQKIVVFNPIGTQRQDVLRIIVSNPCVEVKDMMTGKYATYQVNPVWYVHEYALYQPAHFSRVYIKKTEFELAVILDLEPLSLKIYEITEFGPDKCCFVKNFLEKGKEEELRGESEEGTRLPPNFKRPPHFASIYSLTNAAVETFGVFTSKAIQIDWLVLENEEIVVGIDRDTGFLTNIKLKATNETFKLSLDYHAYEGEIGRSGAYIFKPTTNQTAPNCTDIEFMVIHGPVLTECIIIFHGSAQHTTRIYHVPGPLSQAVQVELMLNLATAGITENTELFLKMKSDIKNGETPVFYSDSNGFQMFQRQKVCEAGVESNFYPSTTCVYIEDEKTRLSVLTEQSHGVSSNREGQIEVMLDRRLNDDDGRGMGEGVLDTRKAIFSYFLLLEQFQSPPESASQQTLLAHTLIDMQTYPLNVFYWKPFYPVNCPPKFNALLSQGLPCDLRIVNLRTYSHPTTENYPLNSALMSVHKRAYSNVQTKALKRTCSLTPRCNNGTGFLKGTRFKHIEVSKLLRVSLTGLYEYKELTDLDMFPIDSYELKSLRIDFK